MRQRTLILRLRHDASGALHVQLSDPLTERQASFASADDLWTGLDHWLSAFATLHSTPPLPEASESAPTNQTMLPPAIGNSKGEVQE